MSWAVLLVLAAGTWVLKAVGPVLAGGRALPARLDGIVALLPPALLAALVAVQTLGDGRGLAIDARLAGVAVAGVAVALRAPFVLIVILGAATAALLRLL